MKIHENWICADACTKERSVDSADHLELLTRRPKLGVWGCFCLSLRHNKASIMRLRGDRERLRRRADQEVTIIALQAERTGIVLGKRAPC